MAARRANGEGSISPRKDGRWDVAIYSRTTSGKRKRIRHTTRTRPEADKKLTELKRQVHQGLPLPDRNWRLGDYLDYWLREVVKPAKRYSTYSQCERTARLHLKPTLGSYPLTQLSVQTIQRFLNEKLAGGCSVPNAQVMKKVLSASLTHAMREEYIIRNPARLTVLPTYDADENEPWSPEEARKFLVAAQSEPLYPAFLLVLINGVRRGEVLGLVWRDIDFIWGTLHLRQHLQRSEDGLTLAPLKTKASKRNLALHSEIISALRAHKKRQALEQQAQGAKWTGPTGAGGLVFPAEHGCPMEPSTLRRAFIRVCRANGIRHVRLHDARDGLATLLDDLDVPVKQTQAILGHSRITTTLEHYIHPRVAKQRGIMDRVGAKLLPERKTDDTDSCRPGRMRSRQLSRQNDECGPAYDKFFSGAGDGTLTRGLILGKSAPLDAHQRWSAVRLLLRNRRCALLLGLVAVNCGRQTSATPQRTKTQIAHLALVAGAYHATRCAPSLRAGRQRSAA